MIDDVALGRRQMIKDYLALEDLIRVRYASVTWTHKIQEKQAEIYERRYGIIATINILAASITSAGIVSTVFAGQAWIKIVSAVVSFVTVFLSALLKSFDFQNMAKANKATATKLVILRDELLLLLYKVKHQTQPLAELIETFDSIQVRVHAAYQEAPQTSDRAVKKAETALIIRNDDTYTDEQIDELLPESLRRGASHE